MKTYHNIGAYFIENFFKLCSNHTFDTFLLELYIYLTKFGTVKKLLLATKFFSNQIKDTLYFVVVCTAIFLQSKELQKKSYYLGSFKYI